MNVLHRDIKPGNILLDAEDQPYLADFGLAKHQPSVTETLTKSGTLLGTVSYMSPEHAQHPSQISTRSEVYSLGAVLFAALTSQPPFRDEYPVETIRKILDQPAVFPKDTRQKNPAGAQDHMSQVLGKGP